MSSAATTLAERLREAAERWSPGVDFGPDLLREAADALEAQDGGLWSGADPRIVTLRRERDELRRLLIAVQVEEINGRLCPRPESHKDRCCPVCRDLWRRIDAALEPEEAESRV